MARIKEVWPGPSGHDLGRVAAIALVRRGGTISVVSVYGGAADPINMMTLFDKQIQLRMGQANA